MDGDSAPGPRTLRATWAYYLRTKQVRLILGTALLTLVGRLALGGPVSPWELLVVPVLLAWWPVQEWLIHVYILHLRPFQIGRFTVDPDVSRQHRRHHREPFDLATVFIPWRTLIATVLLQLVLWPLVMPSLELALTTLSVYLLLTAHYEWVHFICHTPWVPRSAFYKRLWRSHRLHHFKNEHSWMGVSMLAGDRLFGTAPDAAGVHRSRTVRNLGIEDDLGRAAPALS